jgi:hypothetical protein
MYVGAMGNDEKKPIEPPSRCVGRELTRAAVEAAAEMVPGGSTFTKLYQVTHPPKADQEREAWQGAISERTNEHARLLEEHERALAPTETLTGLPAAIAKWMIEECPDGLGDKCIDPSDLMAQFPEADEEAIDEAVAELELFGLVNVRHHLSGWFASLSPEAYEQLDHQIMGWATVGDAVLVAGLMLELKSGDAPTLHKTTGWERRRFNPALQYLLRFFPEGRIRRVTQPDYPSLGVLIEPEDRVKLRRFIAANREDVVR